jgi:hypothetical protein
VADETRLNSPSSFTTVYTYYYHKMQRRLQCLERWISGISRNIGPGLCTILHLNFGELPFYALG